MVRVVFLLAMVVSTGVYAQRGQCRAYAYKQIPEGWRVPGLFSASATYAPSIGIGNSTNNFHLHLFGEYHLSKRVSVKSDSYLFLNTQQATFYDDDLFRSYFGMFYHLNQYHVGNWDVKFGILPGITYLKRTPWLINGGDDPYTQTVAPSVSLAVGFDYYVWRYFHFFTQVSYLHSNVRGFPEGSLQIDEMVFSAGLGFQIPTRRQK